MGYMLRKAASLYSKSMVTSIGLVKAEIGSLLDRYSDRFGRIGPRIIVMRKEERDDKIAEIRDSPTVQLLNEEEEESHLDGETLVELNSQLQTVEEELRRLKPEYRQQRKTEMGNYPVN